MPAGRTAKQRDAIGVDIVGFGMVFEPLDCVSHIIHCSRVARLVRDTKVHGGRCVTELGEFDAVVIVVDAAAVDPAAAGSGAILLEYMFVSGKWFSRLYAAKTADQSSRTVTIFSVRSLRLN